MTSIFELFKIADGGDQWVSVRNGSGYKREPGGTKGPLLYEEVINLQSFCFPHVRLAQALRNSKTEISWSSLLP